VGPGDTFIFVEGPGVKLALVADAGKPGQARKLSELMQAMSNEQRRCRGTAKQPYVGSGISDLHRKF
jgi:hypothetical protein